MLGNFVVDLVFVSRRVAEIKLAIKEQEALGVSQPAVDSLIQSLLVELGNAEHALVETTAEVRRAFDEHRLVYRAPFSLNWCFHDPLARSEPDAQHKD
jgi:hypothetical protein